MSTYGILLKHAGRSLALVISVLSLSACGGGGSGGMGSGGYPPPTPADTTPPTVSVAASAATVSGSTSISATATDDRAVTQVEFLVDGSVIGTDTTTPYSFDWNTGPAADGAHAVTARARDAAGNSTTSATVTVTVQNNRTYSVNVSEAEELPGTSSTATGAASLGVNVATGAMSGTLTLAGISATAAHVHDGFAGQNGPVIVGLTESATTPGTWQLPANATLTAAQVQKLLAGALYLNVHSTANPNGEIRGQILPANFDIGIARLQGLQELPVVNSAGDAQGGVTLNRSAGLATIHLTVRNLAGATAAHLHEGFGGRNGPVLIGLTQDGSDPTHWFAVDQPATPAIIAALASGSTYLNVHTQANPNGEVRGQVTTADVQFVVSRLSGAQEVPSRSTSGQGSVAVTVRRSTRELVVHANAIGVDNSTGAHVHEAYAGTNGAIIVPLTKDPSDATHWSATGATLTEAQFASLQKGKLYVNVHTPANPGGEIRGQLAPASVRVVFTGMSGAEEVPSVASAGAGRAATTVDLAAKTVSIHVRATGLDDATGSHIHRAPRGSNGGIIVPLTQDPSSPGHWSAEERAVTDVQLSDFQGALWYVNVHTPAHPSGEIRGQIGLEPLPPPAPPDTTPPTVSLAPLAASVSGTVTLSATALDNVAVTAVRFRVNGNLVGTVNAAPYTVSWDTTQVANGTVTVTAEAQDAAGNVGQAAGLLVTVNNAPPPLPDTTPPTIVLTALPATVSGMATLSATAQDDVGVTSVRFLLNGTLLGTDATAPYQLSWDTTTVADGLVTIGAEALDAAGNMGVAGPLSVTVSNVVVATLSQLQANIFTPMCSGCHTGGGAVLPSSMNLSSAAASFAGLVNVAAEEQPTVLRVKPNDSSASYLIRKLAGEPGISGARMPLGGPFLSASDMDKVRSWINSGAPNN
jgi:hypothetical protein